MYPVGSRALLRRRPNQWVLAFPAGAATRQPIGSFAKPPGTGPPGSCIQGSDQGLSSKGSFRLKDRSNAPTRHALVAASGEFQIADLGSPIDIPAEVRRLSIGPQPTTSNSQLTICKSPNSSPSSSKTSPGPW